MSARPPSPEPPPEGENEVQRNIRLKVCAYCKKPGARLKCKACFQRTYCDKRCQKNDWKTVHREQCEKLQQVFVPPPAGWREAKEAAERARGGGGGGGGAAAAAAGGCGGGGAAAAADDDDFAHPCPICLDNEDDAYVDGVMPGQCFACGQMSCGGCNANVSATLKCPTCRAPFNVSDAEKFKRLMKLVHDRSPGRHTPAVQYNLGVMYDNGQGVKQDHREAVAWYRKAAAQGDAQAQFNLGNMCRKGQGVKQNRKEAVEWYRKAAEQGFAEAQNNLGVMYGNGQGVPQDFAEALQWWQSAAEHGYENALKALDQLQQHNLVPTPPPGTAVTAILLTSAAGSKHNNKPGIVVTPADGTAVKPGRVVVLLEGAATPISFKLMNLRV